MHDGVRISVVTAAYNAATTIEETILSVHSQSYGNREHIIIDGGSTDGTAEIVNRNRDRISKTVSEPDEGIYDAMNKGLALAEGEIIGFLNADDVYADENVLSRVANAMQTENLDAVFGDAVFVEPDDMRRVVRRYSSRRFKPDRIGWGWMPAHPTLFLRRRVFERYGHFKSNYRIAGDFELVARMFHDGSLRYRHLPEVLVRMRTGGISTGGWRSTLLLNREVLRACRENHIPTNLFKILSKYPAKILEFVRR